MRSRTAASLLGLAGLLAAGLALPLAAAADDGAAGRGVANFGNELLSIEARHVANWVVHARDNHVGESSSGDRRSLPFVIVDKKDAKVFVFQADGRLRGAAPALLGLARGDTSAPGIGDRKLSTIDPHERTTPAGRFVAALGILAHGEDVLWVDYEGAVAIHRVITTNPKERRLLRLATATTLDNRISYGCINVPVKFYEDVLQPAFTGTYGIVYVLPETRPARQVFASYEVEEQAIDEKDAAAPPLMKVSQSNAIQQR